MLLLWFQKHLAVRINTVTSGVMDPPPGSRARALPPFSAFGLYTFFHLLFFARHETAYRRAPPHAGDAHGQLGIDAAAQPEGEPIPRPSPPGAPQKVGRRVVVDACLGGLDALLVDAWVCVPEKVRLPSCCLRLRWFTVVAACPRWLPLLPTVGLPWLARALTRLRTG